MLYIVPRLIYDLCHAEIKEASTETESHQEDLMLTKIFSLFLFSAALANAGNMSEESGTLHYQLTITTIRLN